MTTDLTLNFLLWNVVNTCAWEGLSRGKGGSILLKFCLKKANYIYEIGIEETIWSGLLLHSRVLN